MWADARLAGYIGWGLYGLISTFNFIFYSDYWNRRYTNSKFSNGGLDISFKTAWGAQVWIRNMLNVVTWFIVGFFWALSCFRVPALYTMLAYVSFIATMIHLIRVFTTIFM